MIADTDGTEVQTELPVYKCHQGDIYYVADIQTSGTAINYHIKTGAKKVHFIGALTTGAKVTYQLYKQSTITADGTALPIYNHNHNSTNTMLATVFRGAIASNNGTLFRNGQAGFGSTPGQAVTGQVLQGIEYVFLPNTDYLLIHTPSTSTDMIFIMEMYETA